MMPAVELVADVLNAVIERIEFNEPSVRKRFPGSWLPAFQIKAAIGQRVRAANVG